MAGRLGRRTCPLLATALAATALAGCGSSAKESNGLVADTPAQIVAAARTAAYRAASVHVTGSIVSEGKPISLDMELLQGTGGQGTVTVDGLGVRLIAIESTVFLKGSPAFYARVAGPSAARLLRGRWLKGRAHKGPLASLAALANKDSLIGSVLSDHGRLVRAGTATVAGVRAVGVTDATRGGTLYVAASGAPYPLEITAARGGASEISFRAWNKPVTLTPPSSAISVDQLRVGR